MKKIYLDYAATTPVDLAVLAAMQPYFAEKYGNAGSLHGLGQEAIAAIDKARGVIAKVIDAEFDEIIFTGSATEANNLALRGTIESLLNLAKRISVKPEFQQIEKFSRDLPFGRNTIEIHRPKIIVSSIEHESVLETARDLEKEGLKVVYLPVDKNGVVDLERLKNSLDERTILVSVMCANNEIGTIEPIAEISKIIKDFNHEILFHTDAVQALQYLDCNVNKLGVDLMTLSAHKIYGPKGIGALYIRNGVKDKITPVITGGGQEFGFRSGTENVPSIVGFAEAVKIVVAKREVEKKRVGELKDHFWTELKKIYPKAEINGGLPARAGGPARASEPALPNILNIYFPNQSSEDLLIKFDMAGIAVSSGSACSARSTKPSHVLSALGLPPEKVKSSMRFSFGRSTTKEEVQDTLERMKTII
ncbi:MAG: Aminotransferase [Candidatus Jorgensenbacteria bacterium GW2011_GWC1_48_8]|uniref:cysteine desulfurase n=2 Tax=Candidatus Joergenseniibacteriota TaxID=1752739 RepID=A0A0G1W7R1_9BACT|nr:MAG: Aminotransferase [Candidatus Jorgensenbacteria bacterium GW2011_GWC1_48_8]KKW14615.1 MAG: Aminotransferase [Candidatus Jorgensenbacteria bacterium GW2011_GWB1_50_10]